MNLRFAFVLISVAAGLVCFAGAARAQTDVLDAAKTTVQKPKYYSSSQATICLEKQRMKAREQGIAYDAVAAAKICQGQTGDAGDDEALNDLYQICRLRNSYQTFQKCMLDATTALEKNRQTVSPKS